MSLVQLLHRVQTRDSGVRTEYMEKYDEDLSGNTALIFVSSCVPLSLYSVDHIHRQACSPPSALPCHRRLVQPPA